MILDGEVAVEEWRAAHLDLSEEDLRFREQAIADPELLERSRFAVLDGAKDLVRHPLQAWPAFVGERKLAEIRRVGLAVLELVRGVPRRLLGDPRRIAEFYRLASPERAAEILAPPDGLAATVARGDLIDTADGLQCIEYNVSPNIGGWETSILVDLHRQVPATAAFLGRLGRWSATPTLHRFFRHVISEVRARGLLGSELTVALISERIPDLPPDALPQRMPYLEAVVAQVFAEEGVPAPDVQVLTGPYDLLAVCKENDRDGEVELAGRRIQAIVEFCFEDTPDAPYRAFKAGQVALLNGPLEWMLSNKRTLALLSESAGSDLLSPEEREVIHRHIPWSREVADRSVELRGERLPLMDLLANARERLVLKQGASAGAEAVWIGRITSPAAWDDVVREALASGDWIVQERVDSRPYLFQTGESGYAPHDAIWGPFFFGSDYGGITLRVQPRADGRPVSMRYAATEAVVFEV